MSSSPSPKKRYAHWSPNRKERDEDDFSDMPEFVPHTYVVDRASNNRGRVGVEELAQIVGSKRFRDVKRSANFMPGQFELWNKNKKGGNHRYWGGYQDLDDDGINEFVVRRGKDNTGPLIAVNGYTTKRSDWGARELYYQDNPTRESRSKNGPLKKYMHKFYGPTYDKKTGKITEWGIEPGSEADPLHNKMYDRYIKYTPKNLSPYQAVNKYIVQPALELYLGKQGIDKKTYLAKNKGVGALSRLASAIYEELVKAPIKAYLVNLGKYQEYSNEFQKRHDPEDPNYAVDLEKYVFNKKEVKNVVMEYVVKSVLSDADNLVVEYAERIKGDELRDVDESDI